MGMMMEAVWGAGYRGALRALATGARAVSSLPLAPASWRGLRDRLGHLDDAALERLSDSPVLWLHAASVGELHAARPLLARLRQRYPDRRQLVSTMTRTGMAAAREVPSLDVALLLPFDSPGIVRRFVTSFRLEAFFFTETEIWPSLLHELEVLGVPAVMVSGRVRARSGMQRQALRPIYRPALAEVTCCMQTDDDARGIVALGADPRRVIVAGSLKFDAGQPVTPPSVTRLGRRLGVDRTCLVAGSTHDGEETAVIDAFEALRARWPELIVLLAPRHPERIDGVAADLDRRGLPWIRFSAAAEDTAPVTGACVILLDVMGPLAACYQLATVAFVGGTLAPVGGHNPLEPARVGRPVIVGPFTDHITDLIDALLAAEGALRVDSPAALTATVAQLLSDPVRVQHMGAQARQVADTGAGALERHMKVIAARIGKGMRDRPEFASVSA